MGMIRRQAYQYELLPDGDQRRRMHRFGFARNVAHRVIFMDQGRIVEDATKADFFGTPRSERAQIFLSKILSH
jgi:ABC-type histidine transport system ATPase subunit